MYKLLFALLIAALYLPSASTAAPPNLVGLETPPYPAGYENIGGGLFFNDHNHAYTHLCYGKMIHAAPHLISRCEGQDVVVLQKFIERREKKAYFKVLDEVQLPKMPAERYVLAVPQCSSVSYKDENILAIGRMEEIKDGLVSKDISHAWRFNLQTGKIEPISIHDVICEGDNPD
jgi:hypothetical protein